MKTRIDLEQLRIEIRMLNRHKKLYYILRDELGKLGHWKLRGRGDSVKAYRSRGKNAENF